jgi:hypothetical protein
MNTHAVTLINPWPPPNHFCYACHPHGQRFLKRPYSGPKPRVIGSFEGLSWHAGLTRPHRLLLQPIGIGLAEAAGVRGPQHWLRGWQWWGPAGGHRPSLLGYRTFRWGWLGGWWFWLGGWWLFGCWLLGLDPLGLWLGGGCCLGPQRGLLPFLLLGLRHHSRPNVV